MHTPRPQCCYNACVSDVDPDNVKAVLVSRSILPELKHAASFHFMKQADSLVCFGNVGHPLQARAVCSIGTMMQSVVHAHAHLVNTLYQEMRRPGVQSECLQNRADANQADVCLDLSVLGCADM